LLIVRHFGWKRGDPPASNAKLQVEKQISNIGCVQFVTFPTFRGANQYRAVLFDPIRVRNPAMAAPDDGRIKPNEIHVVAKTEHFSSQSPGDTDLGKFDLRVHEKFHGVVAGFPVDIYGPSVIRGQFIIHPEIIGEPCVGVADAYEFSASLVSDPGETLPFSVKHSFYSFGAFQQLSNARDISSVFDVNMCRLVIGYRKGS
jgi:hypothetical protein